jgi:hypothetical protein
MKIGRRKFSSIAISPHKCKRKHTLRREKRGSGTSKDPIKVCFFRERGFAIATLSSFFTLKVKGI